MRIKLTMLMLMCLCWAGFAATGVKGTLVDAQTGKAVADANILLRDQAIYVVSGSDGVFTISNAAPGTDVLEIIVSGYEDAFFDVSIVDGMVKNLGDLKLTTAGFDSPELSSESFLFNEDELLEDEGIGQSAGTIQGATDDIYYQAANYNFSTVRFRFRGYDQNWQRGYVNGFDMNDLMRGRFNFSMFGGMTSSAFRNRTTEIGTEAAPFGYGSLGGSNNVTTYASEYAPGWKGNVSYTNSNYMLRAMLQYASGLNKHGWAYAFSIIGRYAPEGIVEGTFYNSFGYFASLQKVFNDRHSLNLSTWGAPTERATNNAATQEAYDLAGSNLYNPSWGYLNGKKKSAKIVNSFDPSVMLNWIWTPKMGTKLNTGLAFRSSNYSSSALNYYMTPDPNPNYYKNLPSYYGNLEGPESVINDPETWNDQQWFVADWWGGSKAHRQIDWDGIYQANLLNYQSFQRNPTEENKGRASYILEDRHSDFNAYMLNSYLDHRLNDKMTLQAGLNFNFTDGHYYKTIRNLLGASYWYDIDNFSERDFVGDVSIMQNDLNRTTREENEMRKGDVFGYDYFIRSARLNGWIQNQIVTPHWNVNYAAQVSFTDFWRDGQMMNGRAEGQFGFDDNGNPVVRSYGKGKNHDFVDWGLKVGATYKLNGRNYFTAHLSGGSRAPMPNDAYVSPRTKDTAVVDLKSEKYISADLSYTWNYKNFRGSITGFYTHMWDGMKRTGFFDYDVFAMMNYSMSGIESEYKGVELGLEYKILSNLSVSAAGTFSRYTYENDPWGVRSYENGSEADVVRRVYLKNYYIGGTPQQVYSMAVKYNIKRWFFELNAQWFGDNYYELSPTRHEEMPGLWKFCTGYTYQNDFGETVSVSPEQQYAEYQRMITHQNKLNCEWVMNFSVGKVIYTKFGSVNFNLSINNLLNNRNIQTGGWQEGKFDYTTYNVNKFPNKVYYAQGIRVFFNVGIRF